MTQPWFTANAHAVPEISIFGEIGAVGNDAAEFDRELKALGNPSAINVRIHSPGGSVFIAQAIHSILERHPARIIVVIEGLAASAASLIAMAGDEIHMPENAMMMIHDPSVAAAGGSASLRQHAEILDKVAGSMAAVYARRSGQPLASVLRMMANETWLTAAEAVRLGFATHIEQPIKIAANFDLSRYTRPPVTIDAAAQAYWARQPVPPPALTGPQVRAGVVQAAPSSTIVIRQGVATSVKGAA